MKIVVKEVSNPKEFKIFYQFQNKLYANCKEYVPTLDMDQKNTLRNDPALDYCKRVMLLAYKGDRVVGRIMGMINPRYNDFYGKKNVRFGWFDFENDIEIARALLNEVIEWVRAAGMDHIHGPLAFNTLGRQGMLVEGFENTPPVNCLYNFKYYPEIMARLGFEKECDWVQYKINASQGIPDKIVRIAQMIMQRHNLRVLDIGKLSKSEIRNLTTKFFDAYNECFKAVTNFIPLTDKEREITGKHYFSMLTPSLTGVVVDEENDIAAFGISIPSLSEAFKRAKGKLFPFGWYYILKAYKHYKDIDLMLVGSSPKWASKGISAIYHANLASHYREQNLRWAYTNPQIETNTAALKVWESYSKEPFMRRRCWIKEI